MTHLCVKAVWPFPSLPSPPNTVWLLKQHGWHRGEPSVCREARHKRIDLQSGPEKAAAVWRHWCGNQFSSFEMRRQLRAGELSDGSDGSEHGRPEALAPKCPLSPHPLSHGCSEGCSEHRPPGQTLPLSCCAAFRLYSLCLGFLTCIMGIVVLLLCDGQNTYHVTFSTTCEGGEHFHPMLKTRKERLREVSHLSGATSASGQS